MYKKLKNWSLCQFIVKSLVCERIELAEGGAMPFKIRAERLAFLEGAFCTIFLYSILRIYWHSSKVHFVKFYFVPYTTNLPVFGSHVGNFDPWKMTFFFWFFSMWNFCRLVSTLKCNHRQGLTRLGE